jgi:hypothetical protein
MLAITLSFVLAARLAAQATAEDSVRAAEQARGQALLTADTVALSRLVADNAGAFRGFPFSGKIRYTRVFVRRDGRWQAVAMQQTSFQ